MYPMSMSPVPTEASMGCLFMVCVCLSADCWVNNIQGVLDMPAQKPPAAKEGMLVKSNTRGMHWQRRCVGPDVIVSTEGATVP